MQHISGGYKGISLFIDVNFDRFLMPGALAVALFVGAFIASL
jgi:hypothetical protein